MHDTLRKSVRKRGKVIVAAVVILIVFATVTIELSTVVIQRVHNSLMASLADRSADAFQRELGALVAPLQGQLGITEKWGERGVFNLHDHARMNTLFVPVLEEYGAVTSMLIANEKGMEYMLLRDGATWLTRATNITESSGRETWRRWSSDGALQEEWVTETGYDPRTRPWYLDAIEEAGAGAVAITDPYPFFTTRQIGVTLSKMWRNGKDDVLHVTGVDIPLDGILGLLKTIASEGQRCVLFNEEGLVFVGGRAVGTRRDESGPDSLGLRVPATLEADAWIGWELGGRADSEPIRFTSDGAHWWGDVRSLAGDSSAPFLAVMSTESAFTEESRNRRHLFAAITAGLLLLGGVLMYSMTRVAGSRAVTAEPVDPRSEKSLHALIDSGESDRLEFKSTMRWNLKADKAGKEIELAWLKTVVAYLNTDGGTIIIGVDDDGNVLGLESDDFPNEDKFMLHFNNLIDQHIGLAMAKHIRADSAPIEGKSIFVIECGKATEPVYLRLGKDEKFYVRVGPSSRALSVSEVVRRFKR